MEADQVKGPQDAELSLKLPGSMSTQLDQLCRARGITREEALREALEGYLKDQTRRVREGAFGLWTGGDAGGTPRQPRGRW